MAAKLLHSLADENPDLQKQIGCMTGILQLFDRHNVLHTRHLPHKRPPAGTSHWTNGGFERDYPQTAYDTSERQRISTAESSRQSFSSSCSSSMSSMECNKNAQRETSPFDRITFPETPSRDQTITSPRLSRKSLDLRDVVRDSMYREARVLSVKTSSNEEPVGPAMKHRDDSPRPVDLKESLRVLAKLQESSPWYYNETREAKDGLRHSVSNDALRFSYDGRELNRLSFDSRDTIKSTSKLKELPRLSLDSRVRSMQGYNGQQSGNSIDKPPSSATRPTSVVAKLMGLEALPDSSKGDDSHFTSATENDGLFLKTLKQNDLNRSIRILKSPKSSLKDPVSSPRWKDRDLIMKPVSTSKVPIEPAPWRQPDRRTSQKSSVRVPAKANNSFPSVCSEIEKRLKDLQFKQSGKDLRALTQILEAMQAKGLLETRSEEEQQAYDLKSTSPSHSHRFPNQRNQVAAASTSKGSSDSLRSFDSPIVIMKPANRKGSTDNQERSPRNIRRDSSNDRKPGRPHGGTKECTVSSMKSSGSVSPRLQQPKKVELEKNRSRPPTPPPSDSNKPRRQQQQPNNRQLTESSSPGRKLIRLKSYSPVQSDDQLSQGSNESSHHGDNSSSMQLGSVVSRGSRIDEEVSSSEQSAAISGSMQKFSAPRLDEDGLPAELGIFTSEHRSPVSVLDTSLGRDDASLCKDEEPSPIKQAPDSVKGDGALDSSDSRNDDKWNGFGSSLCSEINRKKLQSIDQLVQKLRRLNSSHNEARTDYIASLCDENTNPDHRYISEILLASGLLLRDLGSINMSTFQLHASGHPINPELFFVLEQTKASKFGKSVNSKPDHEKSHRKLIFDAVNEILVGKLALVGPEPWLNSSKLAKKSLNAQKLLKELCSEVERLQISKQEFCVDEEEDQDSIKDILCEDLIRRSENWSDFPSELTGVVLHVERLVFKDLVSEIVLGEATRPRRQLFTTRH